MKHFPATFINSVPSSMYRTVHFLACSDVPRCNVKHFTRPHVIIDTTSSSSTHRLDSCRTTESQVNANDSSVAGDFLKLAEHFCRFHIYSILWRMTCRCWSTPVIAALCRKNVRGPRIYTSGVFNGVSVLGDQAASPDRWSFLKDGRTLASLTRH